MEPKSPEQLPTPIELQPLSPDAKPERQSPEHGEPSIERSVERSQQTTPPTTTIQLPEPVVSIQQPSAAYANSASTTDDNPALAADEDLIEKEWVDKAKKIIIETKDDPFSQERAIGKLQSDYLKKRYGKDLGNQS